MAKGQARDKATGRFLPKTAKVKGAQETKAKSAAAPCIFLEVRLGFRVYYMASYFFMLYNCWSFCVLLCDMRRKMGLLQDRFEAKDLKDRLLNLEYMVFKNAIEVAEDLKATDKVIA